MNDIVKTLEDANFEDDPLEAVGLTTSIMVSIPLRGNY